jgi:hypothetical protein
MEKANVSCGDDGGENGQGWAGVGEVVVVSVCGVGWGGGG